MLLSFHFMKCFGKLYIKQVISEHIYRILVLYDKDEVCSQ